MIELDKEPATLGSSYSNINSMQTTGRYGNRLRRGSEVSRTLPARVLARLGTAQAQWGFNPSQKTYALKYRSMDINPALLTASNTSFADNAIRH